MKLDDLREQARKGIQVHRRADPGAFRPWVEIRIPERPFRSADRDEYARALALTGWPFGSSIMWKVGTEGPTHVLFGDRFFNLEETDTRRVILPSHDHVNRVIGAVARYDLKHAMDGGAYEAIARATDLCGWPAAPIVSMKRDSANINIEVRLKAEGVGLTFELSPLATRERRIRIPHFEDQRVVNGWIRNGL